ncbi:hypothetical protein BAE44_0020311 [Dichanthelium oligosanthes]|uniref:Uncharacterized protein n=1 Tax=Dichanthelium oligosanthes TaxID=888268 RepID=A0A1E5V0K5_9POAL|nr:hypothetical protein BAE44_0020311 [Dichanthelium oligosanthes]
MVTIPSSIRAPITWWSEQVTYMSTENPLVSDTNSKPMTGGPYPNKEITVYRSVTV